MVGYGWLWLVMVSYGWLWSVIVIYSQLQSVIVTLVTRLYKLGTISCAQLWSVMVNYNQSSVATKRAWQPCSTSLMKFPDDQLATNHHSPDAYDTMMHLHTHAHRHRNPLMKEAGRMCVHIILVFMSLHASETHSSTAVTALRTADYNHAFKLV